MTKIDLHRPDHHRHRGRLPFKHPLSVAGVPWLEWLYDPHEWSLERPDRVLAKPFRARGGWQEQSKAPGLGFTLADRLT
jgi:hypothetical protein